MNGLVSDFEKDTEEERATHGGEPVRLAADEEADAEQYDDQEEFDT